MASLQEIREGVAAAISTLDGIQGSPYMLSNPPLPSAHVYPDETEYHEAFANGAESWHLIVEVFVGMVSDIAAQMTLDKYLASDGPSSVKAALEPAPGEPALGGAASDLIVERTSGYRQYQLGGVQGLALGAQWFVNVLV
jgi:hypothetical protein